MSDQEPAGISQPFLNRVIKGTRGAEILPGGKYDIPRPEEYDLSVFPEEDRDVVDVAVKQLSAYLGYPMITDNFPNHNIRRRWRGQTSKFLHNRYGPEASKAFEKMLRENKLKSNAVTPIIGYVSMLQNYLPEEMVEGILKIGDDFNKGNSSHWNKPTTPERIEAINSLSQKTAAVLNYLYHSDGKQVERVPKEKTIHT